MLCGVVAAIGAQGKGFSPCWAALAKSNSWLEIHIRRAVEMNESQFKKVLEKIDTMTTVHEQAIVQVANAIHALAEAVHALVGEMKRAK
jgi:hypothetical protein